jgi:hypothetical protein
VALLDTTSSDIATAAPLDIAPSDIATAAPLDIAPSDIAPSDIATAAPLATASTDAKSADTALTDTKSTSTKSADTKSSAPPITTEAELRVLAAHLPWNQVEALGSHWALDVRTSLVNEKRAACGGWPGTLSEARARLTSLVSPWSPSAGKHPVTTQQFESLAGVLYASARNTWRTYSEREKAIDDVE